MHASNTIPQGSASCGQALAAIGILLFLAITVPLLGVLMIPVVALRPLARALTNVSVPTSAAVPRLRPAPRPFAAPAISGR